MIKPAKHNAINFSDDFNRESIFFSPELQRSENILSYCAGYLSFSFTPSSMPESVPTATLTSHFINGLADTSYIHDYVIELTDSYIYFFRLFNEYPVGIRRMSIYIVGYEDEPIYSELTNILSALSLAENGIVTLVAYNNDNTHGYLNETYPACGFFQFSEFNCQVFGNEKVVFNYAYGRKKILSSENYIKTRLTFCNLSMYQQNLLKWLCNCENLTINGVAYCLVSDFIEKNKDELNEICDLQAEFIEVDNSFFATGADSVSSIIKPSNLFM
jgi:hypothetical protein